jgi:hypothetical protein
MISILVLSLLLAEPPMEPAPGCEANSPVRDPAICEPLYDDGSEYKIYNMESVAVGSVKEIKRVREMTRHCNVDNRIDYVGPVDLVIYDIVNADQVSTACVTGWISQNQSGLIFSEQSFQQKYRDAPILKESDVP